MPLRSARCSPSREAGAPGPFRIRARPGDAPEWRIPRRRCAPGARCADPCGRPVPRDRQGAPAPLLRRRAGARLPELPPHRRPRRVCARASRGPVAGAASSWATRHVVYCEACRAQRCPECRRYAGQHGPRCRYERRRRRPGLTEHLGVVTEEDIAASTSTCAGRGHPAGAAASSALPRPRTSCTTSSLGCSRSGTTSRGRRARRYFLTGVRHAALRASATTRGRASRWRWTRRTRARRAGDGRGRRRSRGTEPARCRSGELPDGCPMASSAPERRRPRKGLSSEALRWLRGLDLNQRPLGYEPNELPDCSTPR